MHPDASLFDVVSLTTYEVGGNSQPTTTLCIATTQSQLPKKHTIATIAASD